MTSIGRTISARVPKITATTVTTTNNDRRLN